MGRDLEQLNPYVKHLAELLIQQCKDKGIDIIVTQTLRTIKEQDDLYAIGRSKPGKKVTNAPGGYSIHNYGFAFDICVLMNGKECWDDSAYVPVGKIGQELGLEWGGAWISFQDTPHFQYTNGLTIKDFINGKRPKAPEISKLREEKKVDKIVMYGNDVDKRAAEYLADHLGCPIIHESHITKVMNQVNKIYAIGGNFKPTTDTILITGADRYETIKAVLKFIGKL